MTEASAGPKGGKLGRKHGRNKLGCKAYALSNSAIYTKAKGIADHLFTPGNDYIAVGALQRLCKVDTKANKAFGGVNSITPSRYDQQMRTFAKRAAKARRQWARANDTMNLATTDNDTKAASLAEASLRKAQRYLNRYARV